ncbi:hypothetical protein GCM10022279_18890 [Comamonas faecalis]|uniref:Uncharacterized protein n=1 Tax=Comamonas faecalis TaxID=1387849 RepID=A0ABP7RC01_9BURK
MGGAFAGTDAHLRRAAQARRDRHPRRGLSGQGQETDMLSEQQKKANVRTALILASISLALLIGFVVNMAWMH